MPIPIHREPDDELTQNTGQEKCCFCRTPSPFWTSLSDRKPGEQVACCTLCAARGEVGKNLTFNAVGWGTNIEIGPYEIVDGKQRLEAVRAWLRDEFKAHGYYRSEFTDRMRLHMGFKWRICSLETRAEILQLYLNINAGGTPHTQAELGRVREMLAHEKGMAKCEQCTTCNGKGKLGGLSDCPYCYGTGTVCKGCKREPSHCRCEL